MAGALCIAALAGGAHSTQATGYWGKAEPSGFLKDYSKLHPAADDTEATLTKSKTGGQGQVQILHEGLAGAGAGLAREKLMQRIWIRRMPNTCPNSSGQSSMKNSARIIRWCSGRA